MADGIQVLLLGGPRTAVEDEEDRLGLFGADGFLDVGLMLAEQLRVQLDVARLLALLIYDSLQPQKTDSMQVGAYLVDSVNITESYPC